MNGRGGSAARVGRLVAAGAMILLGGCTQTTSVPTPIGTRPAPAETTGSRTEVFPFGRIPYDNTTLPLIHPDGTLIATQTGLPQTEAVRLASESAPPIGARVEVFRAMPSDGASGKGPALEPEFAVEAPVLLGRSSSADGFIVEAPQAGGSRWIGLASWQTGQISWLVNDERVNAFASLGPDGRLAWCRREENGRFEIVVSHAGEEWTIGDTATSWLMPAWSPTGEGLFALRLSGDGLLDAVYLHGSDGRTMLAATRSIRLSNAADLRTVAGIVAAQPLTVGVSASAQPALVFQHPEFNAVGVWRPFRSDAGATKRLERGSASAAIDDNGFVLYSSASGMMAHHLDDPVNRVRVLNDVSVPFLTKSASWRYLLFAPTGSGSGELFVIGLNLLQH